MMNSLSALEDGKTVLGIEFGSTRIKACLMDECFQVIATGSYRWENSLIGGIWSYPLDEILHGLQQCYFDLKESVFHQYKIILKKVGRIGVSAMMHGYLPFDSEDNLLVPYRTWRNTITKEASDALSELFHFNIPQRWSIAHLYQAILNEEEHVKHLSYFTTLAGYIHYRLTGVNCLGIGDASGMFPVDEATHTYQQEYIDQFEELIQGKYPWKLQELLPSIRMTGEEAGKLTKEGARLLDPSGELEEGAIFCPPEGDAQTGMVATNSIKPCTCNVSAGTSVFSMAVLKEPLKIPHEEIDVVLTPTGHTTAMVHGNNCCGDIDAWVHLFEEMLTELHLSIDINTLYEAFYDVASNGEADAGGIVSYNFFSGEPVLGLSDGYPLLKRDIDSRFSLGNLSRSLLYSSLAVLKVGNDLLIKEEGVTLDVVYAQGGLFKSGTNGTKALASALRTPVQLFDNASEGGAWGMALLAVYPKYASTLSLEDFLADQVFVSFTSKETKPEKEWVDGFDRYIQEYKKNLGLERKQKHVRRTQTKSL